MTEKQMNTTLQVLKYCRRKGVTLEDLIEALDLAIESRCNSDEPSDTISIEEIKAIPEISEESLEKQVTDILRNFGIPANIKGYQYSRYAIIYAVENVTALDAITKELYPAVAKEFKTTPSKVERAIRHAIEVAFDKGNIKALEKFFGYTMDFQKGKPANSQFIALIVDDLKHS